jgi:hypothetical protein
MGVADRKASKLTGRALSTKLAIFTSAAPDRLTSRSARKTLLCHRRGVAVRDDPYGKRHGEFVTHLAPKGAPMGKIEIMRI